MTTRPVPTQDATHPATQPGVQSANRTVGQAADQTSRAQVDPAELLPDVAFRPVREGQAYEATLGQLASAIRLGLLPAGSQVPPERELASRLGVSRVTLREAMDSLRRLGMITTRRGRGGGSFVTDDWATMDRQPHDGPGLDQLEDALTFRAVVEPGAAAAAAARDLSQSQRDWLMTCLQEVTDLSDDDIQRPQADARFHLAVAGLSASPSLVEAVSRSQDLVRHYLALIPSLPRNIEHSNADHEAIAAAILEGDADAAREIAEEHCDKTAQLLRGLLSHTTSHTTLRAPERVPPRDAPSI